MTARELLEKWRPSATPGAPSAAGVPADRVAERSAELEPVLALIVDAQQEATRTRSAAAAEADRRRATAHERARALIAEAHRTARSERSAAAAAAQAAGETAARRINNAAAAESAAIADRARTRIPDLVASIREQARVLIVAMTQEDA